MHKNKPSLYKVFLRRNITWEDVLERILTSHQDEVKSRPKPSDTSWSRVGFCPSMSMWGKSYKKLEAEVNFLRRQRARDLVRRHNEEFDVDLSVLVMQKRARRHRLFNVSRSHLMIWRVLRTSNLVWFTWNLTASEFVQYVITFCVRGRAFIEGSISMDMDKPYPYPIGLWN